MTSLMLILLILSDIVNSLPASLSSLGIRDPGLPYHNDSLTAVDQLSDLEAVTHHKGTAISSLSNNKGIIEAPVLSRQKREGILYILQPFMFIYFCQFCFKLLNISLFLCSNLLFCGILCDFFFLVN